MVASAERDAVGTFNGLVKALSIDEIAAILAHFDEFKAATTESKISAVASAFYGPSMGKLEALREHLACIKSMSESALLYVVAQAEFSIHDIKKAMNKIMDQKIGASEAVAAVSLVIITKN